MAEGVTSGATRLKRGSVLNKREVPRPEPHTHLLMPVAVAHPKCHFGRNKTKKGVGT